MILIGVAGLARSGKDTAAAYLARELGLYQYAFAEPLKTMLKSVFGDHFHHGDRSGICPEAGISYRALMQTLGTEWGREQVNPDLWVNLVGREFDKLKANPFRKGAVFDARLGDGQFKGMILSDVRFDSEAQWIRDNGGKVIRVYRGGSALGTDHASEKGVSHELIDFEVNNNGPLERLPEHLHYAVHSLGLV